MNVGGVMDEARIRKETFHRDEEVESRDTRRVRDSIHLHGNCRPGERYLPTVTRTRGSRTSPAFYIARDRALLTHMSLYKRASIARVLISRICSIPLLSLSEKKNLIHRRSVGNICAIYLIFLFFSLEVFKRFLA